MVKAAQKPDVLRIMAWNIRHGGRSGIPAIVERIAGHAPDIAVISEYRCNDAGDKLRTGLSETGLSEFRFIPPLSIERSADRCPIVSYCRSKHRLRP